MKIYLIHCWTAYTQQDGVADWHPKWYDWLAQQYPTGTVEILRMPNSERPKIAEWLNHLEAHVPNIDNFTYFVGHSIGCQAILRFLAKKKPQSLGGVALISPWFELQGLSSNDDIKIASPWESTPIDFTALKPYAPRISAILSDNDRFVNLVPNLDLIKKNVTSDVRILPKRDHFDADSDAQLPELMSILPKPQDAKNSSANEHEPKGTTA